jgi:C_GCAxxG_C_C family probable redox protein
MTENEEIAMITFRSGYNCAQAVLTTFADEMGYDYDKALNITTGFGAGMGRLQQTCGAVTGGFMVISIYCSNKYRDIADRKENTYALIREFDGRFREMHGSSNCRELTGCDLLTEEGRQKMISENIHESVCEKCVTGSVKILEELMGDSR